MVYIGATNRVRIERSLDRMAIEMAATGGDTAAMRAMAARSARGRHADWRTAREWLTKAAELGDLTAMTRVGDLERRQGHRAEACRWFDRAASMGHRPAMRRLAAMLRPYGLDALWIAVGWCRAAMEDQRGPAWRLDGELLNRLLVDYHLTVIADAYGPSAGSLSGRAAGAWVGEADYTIDEGARIDTRRLLIEYDGPRLGEVEPTRDLQYVHDALADDWLVVRLRDESLTSRGIDHPCHLEVVCAADPAGPDVPLSLVQEWLESFRPRPDHAQRSRWETNESDRQAARNGDEQAMRRVAACAWLNSSPRAETLHWFTELAERGDVGAMVGVGELTDTESDRCRWLDTAAMHGNQLAMVRLALCLRRHGPWGMWSALDWCQRAARGADPSVAQTARNQVRSLLQHVHADLVEREFGRSELGIAPYWTLVGVSGWFGFVSYATEVKKLIIEYDGPWDGDDWTRELDTDKSESWLAKGWLVVRLRDDSLPSLGIEHPHYLEVSCTADPRQPNVPLDQVRVWLDELAA